MKQSRSAVRDLSPREPEADPYMDETMAMVYVGDVYSLVAQESVRGDMGTRPAPNPSQKHNEPRDENDAVWPFIR